MQDDKIKSMLEDVEVPAPRRVWRNVAAQLDAAAAPVATGREWMGWAAAALAFAVLAVGAFLFVPRTSSEDIIPTYQNITAAHEPQIPSVKEESEPFVSAIEDAPVRKGTPVMSNLVAEAMPVETVDVAESGPVDVVPLEVVADDASETVVLPAEPDGSASALFAQMALEDQKKFSRGIKSIYAQGSIGGNDSDISFLTNKARMSSGISVKKTGITELDESEFGIPISFGIGFRYYILPGFSIGSGLSYSLLSRTFNGLYEEVESGKVINSQTGSVHHTMRYLGIPLNAYYDIISADKIKFYVYGGGEAEVCLANKYTLYSDSDIHYSSPVERLQWSLNAGLGVEFKLTTHMGLYLDPSAKYFFHCNQPKNIRTERPLMFNFDAGLRFNF